MCHASKYTGILISRLAFLRTLGKSVRFQWYQFWLSFIHLFLILIAIISNPATVWALSV